MWSIYCKVFGRSDLPAATNTTHDTRSVLRVRCVNHILSECAAANFFYFERGHKYCTFSPQNGKWDTLHQAGNHALRPPICLEVVYIYVEQIENHQIRFPRSVALCNSQNSLFRRFLTPMGEKLSSLWLSKLYSLGIGVRRACSLFAHFLKARQLK